MSRAQYKYETTDCLGGINESEESCRPSQCTDLRNVYESGGRVVERPGYAGTVVGMYPGALPLSLDAAWRAGTRLITEDNVGAVPAYVTVPLGGTLDLSNFTSANPDRWYMGAPTRVYPITNTPIAGFYIGPVTQPNSNSVGVKAEYWNGLEWRILPSFFEYTQESIGYSVKVSEVPYHFSPIIPAAYGFTWIAPEDWVASTVNGSTLYFVRLTLVSQAVAALDAVTSDPVSPLGVTFFVSNPLNSLRGILAAQFPASKLYITLSDNTTASHIYYAEGPQLAGGSWQVHRRDEFVTAPPATIAVVPQYSEAFVTYGGIVTHHKVPVDTGWVVAKATVEDRDYLVGDFATYPTAVYDRNLIPQLAGWPHSKYIMFFKNMLWAANFENDPYSVRWSAPAPYHRVWPTLQFEPLMEDDNSPITGLNALDEYPVVFKQDSIWNMVFTGTDSDNLTAFAPIRTVVGVGCVSNSSIQKIKGNLVFLSESGIYAYNGTGDIKKISLDQYNKSDRLAKTIKSIVPGRRAFAVSAHWRTKGLYLLAVSVNGSDKNNVVIVWDYQANSFWIWDNIEAQTFLVDETSSDDEAVYFGDSYGRVFQLGVGTTDNGAAISSYVQTGRFGYGQQVTKTARLVRLHSSSKSRDLTVKVIPNDQYDEPIVATMDLIDAAEKDWGDLTFAVDNWRGGARRDRRIDYRATGDWFQVRVYHENKNQPFELSKISLGWLPRGVR